MVRKTHPEYTKSIALAWELVNHPDIDGMKLSVTWDGDVQTWVCDFKLVDSEETFRGVGDSAPLSICSAWVKMGG